MIDFNYASPTKIYFGKSKEDLIGSILSERKFKKVLLIYGHGSIKKNGLYDKVIASLSANGISYFELCDVRPNPSNDLVQKGIMAARKEKVDCLLAIGGGSVIDTAKAISAGYFYDGDSFDFNLHKLEPKQALPIGVILTLAASGSELSNSCVISNDELGIKQGFNADIIRPLFAILNPELTYSVNKFQTGCGVVDIISHSLERYFSKSDAYEFADDIALAIIKNTIACGQKCIDEPNNYDARADMMINGSFSHNGISGLGKKVVMPIHAMEHAISAYKNDIAHGAGLSVLIPGWMEYVYESDAQKFAKFAKDVFDIRLASANESAKMGIQSLKDFFQKIGMPTSLTELGINKNDIPSLAEKMTKNGTLLIGYSSIKPLDKKDIINLLMSIL